VYLESIDTERPIPVAAPSKASVYGRSPVGIVGLNPARAMHISRECCVCVVRYTEVA